MPEDLTIPIELEGEDSLDRLRTKVQGLGSDVGVAAKNATAFNQQMLAGGGALETVLNKYAQLDNYLSSRQSMLGDWWRGWNTAGSVWGGGMALRGGGMLARGLGASGAGTALGTVGGIATAGATVTGVTAAFMTAEYLERKRQEQIAYANTAIEIGTTVTRLRQFEGLAKTTGQDLQNLVGMMQVFNERTRQMTGNLGTGQDGLLGAVASVTRAETMRPEQRALYFQQTFGPGNVEFAQQMMAAQPLAAMRGIDAGGGIWTAPPETERALERMGSFGRLSRASDAYLRGWAGARWSQFRGGVTEGIAGLTFGEKGVFRPIADWATREWADLIEAPRQSDYDLRQRRNRGEISDDEYEEIVYGRNLRTGKTAARRRPSIFEGEELPATGRAGDPAMAIEAEAQRVRQAQERVARLRQQYDEARDQWLGKKVEDEKKEIEKRGGPIASAAYGLGAGFVYGRRSPQEFLHTQTAIDLSGQIWNAQQFAYKAETDFAHRQTGEQILQQIRNPTEYQFQKDLSGLTGRARAKKIADQALADAYASIEAEVAQMPQATAGQREARSTYRTQLRKRAEEITARGITEYDAASGIESRVGDLRRSFMVSQAGRIPFAGDAIANIERTLANQLEILKAQAPGTKGSPFGSEAEYSEARKNAIAQAEAQKAQYRAGETVRGWSITDRMRESRESLAAQIFELRRDTPDMRDSNERAMMLGVSQVEERRRLALARLREQNPDADLTKSEKQQFAAEAEQYQQTFRMQEETRAARKRQVEKSLEFAKFESAVASEINKLQATMQPKDFNRVNDQIRALERNAAEQMARISGEDDPQVKYARWKAEQGHTDREAARRLQYTVNETEFESGREDRRAAREGQARIDRMGAMMRPGDFEALNKLILKEDLAAADRYKAKNPDDTGMYKFMREQAESAAGVRSAGRQNELDRSMQDYQDNRRRVEEAHQLRLLDFGGKRMDMAQKYYDLAVRNAKEDYQRTKDSGKFLEDLDAARIGREETIARLRREQVDYAKASAGALWDAMRAGGGEGAKGWLRGQGEMIAKGAFSNVAGMAMESTLGKIFQPAMVRDGRMTVLGQIFKDTVIGPRYQTTSGGRPPASVPTSYVPSYSAWTLLGGVGGGQPAGGGGEAPGNLPDNLPDTANRASYSQMMLNQWGRGEPPAPGLVGSVTPQPSVNPETGGQYDVEQALYGASVGTEALGRTVAGAAGTKHPGLEKAGRYVGAAGAAAGAVFGVKAGIQQGGTQGALTAAGSAVGGAATALSLAGAAGPWGWVAAGGIALTMAAGLWKSKAQQIAEEREHRARWAFERQYASNLARTNPVRNLSYSFAKPDYAIDYDVFGNPRSYPSEITFKPGDYFRPEGAPDWYNIPGQSQVYQSYREPGTVPAPPQPQYQVPPPPLPQPPDWRGFTANVPESRGVRNVMIRVEVPINVNAMNSKSFLDNRTEIANAVRTALFEDHPLLQDIRRA